MGIIYKVTHLEDETVYIGQSSKSLEERRLSHISYVNNILTRYNKGSLKDYNDKTFPFQYYFEGEDLFEWEVIDTANTQEGLNIKEQYWIKYYNNLTNGNIYNIRQGGHNGCRTPLYYDGSSSEKSFLNNNSIVPSFGEIVNVFKEEEIQKITLEYLDRQTWNNEVEITN